MTKNKTKVNELCRKWHGTIPTVILSEGVAVVEISPWAIHSNRGISHCVRNDRVALVVVGNQALLVVVVGGQAVLVVVAENKALPSLKVNTLATILNLV